MDREEKAIYMGQVCTTSLIAKYFAISEVHKICLCTNEFAPRVPYPLELPELRQNFADGETSLEHFC